MKTTLIRKLLLGTAIAAVSLPATTAWASGGADTQWATVDNHGFLGIDLMLEGGYTFSDSNQLTYAQFNDGYANGGGTVNSPFKINTGDGTTGKAGIAARFEGGWTFGLNYSGIRTTQTADSGTFDQSNSRTPYPLWNVLGSNTTSYNEISVSTKSNVDMLDLTVGYDVGLGGDETLVVTGGMRYAKFMQSTSTDIWCSALRCGVRVYRYSDSLTSTYRGVGPLLGASYTMPVGDSGFSIFGNALGSVLFGKQTTNRWFSSGPVSTEATDRHVAYSAEGQAGLSYKIPDHPATISFGYQLAFYDRVRDTTNGTGYDGTTTPQGTYGHSADSLFYHGPFARLVVSLP